MRNRTFGMLIAEYRKEKGMTQLELAEKMGVTDKAVSKWERDLSYPDVNSLPKLAGIFGISVDQLMQIKTNDGPVNDRPVANRIIPIVFKALSLAMGIAVVVLSVMKAIDMYSGFFMLGLGLACAGISLLSEKKRDD